MTSGSGTSAHSPLSGDPARIIARVRAAAISYRAGGAHLPAPLRVYEVFEGRGSVYRGAECLGEVDYWLKDVEMTDETVFPTGHREEGESSDPRTGRRSTFGLFRAATKEDFLRRRIGEALALRLQDGRTLEFTATKVLLIGLFCYVFRAKQHLQKL